MPVLGELGLGRGSIGHVHEVCGVSLRPVVMGVGRQRVAEKLEGLLEEHRPNVVVLVGVSGGLSEQVKCGDILIGAKISGPHGDARHMAVTKSYAKDLEGLANVHVDGHLHVSDVLVSTPAQKMFTHQQTQADAVDMESFYVAELAAAKETECVVLRAISDEVGHTLLPASLGWIKPNGAPRLGKVLMYLAGHPHHLPHLMQMGRSFKCATRSLGKATVVLLESIGEQK